MKVIRLSDQHFDIIASLLRSVSMPDDTVLKMIGNVKSIESRSQTLNEKEVKTFLRKANKKAESIKEIYQLYFTDKS